MGLHDTKVRGRVEGPWPISTMIFRPLFPVTARSLKIRRLPSANWKAPGTRDARWPCLTAIWMHWQGGSLQALARVSMFLGRLWKALGWSIRRRLGVWIESTKSRKVWDFHHTDSG